MPRRTVRRSLAAIAAVALTVLLVPSAPSLADSAAAGKAAVKVTINDSADSGRVSSRTPACERHRAVTVLGFTDMGVLYFGDDVTDNQGRWTIRATSHRARPKGLALVPGDNRCAPAQSRYVDLVERAGKAKRKISLQGGGTNPNGRVTSSSGACERGADVVLFARENEPSAPWQLGGTTTTNGQGRYNFGGARPAGVRGMDYQLTTLVVGTKACRLAQSPIMTVRTR